MNISKEWQVLKVAMRLHFFVIIFFSIPFIFPYNSFAEESQAGKKENQTARKENSDASKAPIPVNPFNIAKNRVIPNSIFKIEIDKDSFNKIKDNIIEMSLKYETGKKGEPESVSIKRLFFRHKDGKTFLFAKMPSWTEITKKDKDIRTQSPWRGWLKPYKANIEILYKKAEDKERISFPIEIPDVFWASAWAIMTVVGSFVVIWALKPEPLKKQEGFAEDRSKEEWEKSSMVKRFILYPLNFAITPIGTYSISITQILIWTFITIFGIVYVYWLTGTFIEITAQMLTLLGIGGGTALAAKMNALSRVKEIPAKYLNLVKKTRTPKLKDLISIGGQPNIYKFQMLAFTLLTVYIVVVEIAKNYAFPIIPDSLITLMGISSIVYLGNEVTHKNVWDKIKEKVDAIEKYATANNKPVNNTQQIEALGIPEKEELKNLLNGIYS